MQTPKGKKYIMFLLHAASLSPKGPENPILALKDHFFLQLLHLL